MVDAAVVTGLFALGGVVVGGLINVGATYSLERRRESQVAMKDARVVAPRFLRLAMAMGSAIDEEWTWEALSLVIEANLEEWDRFADVFAGTLAYDDWFTLYQAVRPMELVTHWDARDDGSRVGGEGAEQLREIIDRVVEAAMVLTVVGISGTKRRRLRRALNGLRWRLWPPNDDDLLREAGFDPSDFDNDVSGE